MNRNLQTHYGAERKRIWEAECNKGFTATLFRRKKTPTSPSPSWKRVLLPCLYIFLLFFFVVVDGFFFSPLETDPSNPQPRSTAEYIACSPVNPPQMSLYSSIFFLLGVPATYWAPPLHVCKQHRFCFLTLGQRKGQREVGTASSPPLQE